MDDVRTYQIEIQGRVEAGELIAVGPLQLTRVCGDSVRTQLAVRTDQSGLIGLLRYLHGRGEILLSVWSGRLAGEES
jgi:hypothetical protein